MRKNAFKLHAFVCNDRANTKTNNSLYQTCNQANCSMNENL